LHPIKAPDPVTLRIDYLLVTDAHRAWMNVLVGDVDRVIRDKRELCPLSA
jgi:hypothetical protein